LELRPSPAFVTAVTQNWYWRSGSRSSMVIQRTSAGRVYLLWLRSTTWGWIRLKIGNKDIVSIVVVVVITCSCCLCLYVHYYGEQNKHKLRSEALLCNLYVVLTEIEIFYYCNLNWIFLTHFVYCKECKDNNSSTPFAH